MGNGCKLSIFHPTDFTWTSTVAFAHALKLAVVCGDKFTVLHTGSRSEPSKDWHLFPRVRATLINWGLLEPGCSEYAVYDELGIAVEKIDVHKIEPTAAIASHLINNPTDLVVIGVRRSNGTSYAGPYHVSGSGMDEIDTDALFIPDGVSGFVSVHNGTSRLYRILLPITPGGNPMSAILDAAALGRALGGEKADLTLLHLGAEADGPQILYDTDRIPCPWHRVIRKGAVVDAILSTADDISADLIVTAASKNGTGLPAHTEFSIKEVLKFATCPVLAVRPQ